MRGVKVWLGVGGKGVELRRIETIGGMCLFGGLCGLCDARHGLSFCLNAMWNLLKYEARWVGR